MATPVEELIPPGKASKLHIEPRRGVDIRVSLGPLPRQPRLPGWAYGLAAVVVVLMLAIPVWLRMSSPVVDVADTPTPIAVSAPPAESADPFLRAESGGVVTGFGWLPSSPITFSVNGFEGDESFESDSAGRFNFRVTSIGLRFEPGDVLSATDGTSTRQMTIPDLIIDTFDPGLGVASGTTSLPDGALVELRIPAPGENGLPLRLQTTVRAGARSFAFEPVSPEQIEPESWISVHSGDGPYEVRLEP
jgi:hypothetical protein